MFVQIHALLSQLSKLNQTVSKTKLLHGLLIKTRLSYDPFYATRIIRFYAINNDLTSACNLFDETPNRSVYLWNSIIRAFARVHRFHDALQLFRAMLTSETKPDSFTFACILRACSERVDFKALRIVHGRAIASGFGLDSICCSALVTAYSKVGLVNEASKNFYRLTEPDLVLWNSMISGYGGSGYWDKGLHLFTVMRSKGNLPDGYTLVGLISCLVDSSFLKIGQGVHGLCIKSGFDSNAHVSSALVSMYSRCKCMYSACNVFDGIFQPDLVTWSALMSGFSLSGDYKNALVFFKKMIMQGTKADHVLIASLLAATAQLAIAGPGIEIHGYAIRRGFDFEVMVSSALIEMYSKCGFLSLGIRVFKGMPKRNIVSHNSMISGFGLYGLASEAIDIFKRMLEERFNPDESTFSGLLCACCHAGLVIDGRQIFRRMEDEFCIKANTEHYVYLVKLLGMAGELEEAYNLVQSLPEPVDSGILGALLSCCDAHKNTKLAEIVAQRLFEKQPEKSTYRIMLSNVYAGDGKWEDVKKLRDDMVFEGRRKNAGVSWIENSEVLTY